MILVLVAFLSYQLALNFGIFVAMISKGASYVVATITRLALLWGPLILAYIYLMIMLPYWLWLWFTDESKNRCLNFFCSPILLLCIYLFYYPFCHYFVSGWWNFIYYYEISGMLLLIPALVFSYGAFVIFALMT